MPKTEYRNEVGDKIRAECGPGEWQDEPDKIVWIDNATTLDCLMVRNRMGSWCGYVGVPSTHPLYGLDHNKVDLAIHGGLTFSDSCHPNRDPAMGICHVPEPGRPDNIWWFGFDCGHITDLIPYMVTVDEMIEAQRGLPKLQRSGEVYRNVEWVTKQVTHLAEQLAEARDEAWEDA